MIVGQPCIVVGDGKVPGHNHRLFGVVASVGKKWVVVRLADGRLVRRDPRNVSTYAQPPANWPELFAAMERITPRRKLID